MSREPELYKDKVEVSLDGRQIFYLFFGGAVIVGLVFVLGVMVGRRVEARGHIERAHVEASADPLAALDRLEGGKGLTFQGVLRGAPPPVTPVERTIEQGENKKPEKVVEEKKPEKVVEDKKPEKVAEDKKPEKVAEDKKPEKVAEDKKPDEKKPRFTLQLSSFQDRAEAQAFADSIRAAGFEPHVTEGEVDGKQFYRVRLGTYRTLEAANDAKEDFEKTAKKSALVTKL